MPARGSETPQAKCERRGALCNGFHQVVARVMVLLGNLCSSRGTFPILSRDPDHSRKPPETRSGKRIRFLERKMVENNGIGINPYNVCVWLGNLLRARSSAWPKKLPEESIATQVPRGVLTVLCNPSHETIPVMMHTSISTGTKSLRILGGLQNGSFPEWLHNCTLDSQPKRGSTILRNTHANLRNRNTWIARSLSPARWQRQGHPSWTIASCSQQKHLPPLGLFFGGSLLHVRGCACRGSRPLAPERPASCRTRSGLPPRCRGLGRCRVARKSPTRSPQVSAPSPQKHSSKYIKG